MKERAWLYTRLSRDEDPNQESLVNQRNILHSYAMQQGYVIAGESSDDNISGRIMNRPGIKAIEVAAKKDQIDLILVKDFSRMGRNRVYVAEFVERMLSKYGVRVISVSENLDSGNEDDDVLISLMNFLHDQYLKDLSRKIRYGFTQKFSEGLTTQIPYGYFYDRNTGKICIVNEQADVVKTIYEKYIDGMSSNKIANFLTEAGYPTPSKLKTGKGSSEWNMNTINKILIHTAYIGILQCGRYSSFLKDKDNPSYVHENFYPVIVDQALWNQVQIIKEQKRRKTPPKPSIPQKYSKFVVCNDCGKHLIALEKKGQVCYECTSYRKYGKRKCFSYLITEEHLEKILNDCLLDFSVKVQSLIDTLQKSSKGKSKWLLGQEIHKAEERKRQIETEMRENLRIAAREPDKELEMINSIDKLSQERKHIEFWLNENQECRLTTMESVKKLKKLLSYLNDVIGQPQISKDILSIVAPHIVLLFNNNAAHIELSLNSDYQDSVDYGMTMARAVLTKDTLEQNSIKSKKIN